MGSFGENLRRERQLRGISLEEIAVHTKLSTRMLEAIEKDRFDLLPGGMFNRSFVLHYARYLGLDEAQVAADFENAFGGTSPVDIRQVAYQQVERSVPEAHDWAFLEKLQPMRGLLAGILLGALLIAAGFVAVRKGWVTSVRAAADRWVDRKMPVAPPPPVLAAPTVPSQAMPAAAPSQQPAVENPQNVAAQGQDAQAAGTQGQNSTTAPAANSQKPGEVVTPGAEAQPQKPGATPVAARELLLQIDTPLDSAWVEVFADGRRQWGVEMKKGETRRVKASSAIQLRTGNAGGVILTLNGETQAPLGARGEVKSVKFTLQDVKKP